MVTRKTITTLCDTNQFRYSFAGKIAAEINKPDSTSRLSNNSKTSGYAITPSISQKFIESIHAGIARKMAMNAQIWIGTAQMAKASSVACPEGNRLLKVAKTLQPFLQNILILLAEGGWFGTSPGTQFLTDSQHGDIPVRRGWDIG